VDDSGSNYLRRLLPRCAKQRQGHHQGAYLLEAGIGHYSISVQAGQDAKSPTLKTLGILPVPPFLIPYLASNSHSSFEELGHACVNYLKDLELTCKDGLAISENSHCHALVQFMWWAAKGMPETEDYRIAVTLLVDPRPSVVKWRNSAISGALATEAAQPRTG
jgi:hypothetical protein